ncbi:DNA-methyltransferase [Hymenobacter metallicola]|uniref:Methyltransferase n=1 Tax=Hymenobacter metallicola TaxID=2563114 RepID=A0A4Z0QK04_9BACT|nr:site-specific DNA-methyltransferase [Hymenobacter metallicola]TGE29836.1 site-specific DNA-methyltransferase [Hymenobacter metallicola]
MYALHHQDCLQVMASLPDGSVDAIIADPPYLTTNLHFDQGAFNWSAWWVQARRVLKDNGVVVLFAADLFTLDLIQSNREWYRYRMVWAKSRASRFLDAAWRPLAGHEDLIVFAPNIKAATYNAQKQQTSRNVGRVKRKPDVAQHYQQHRGGEYNDTGERHPTTVLDFASVPTVNCAHPTEKPVDLLRWLVSTYTNEGDTVLDCFAGSGSTGHACLVEGRRFIGCELHLEYYTAALTRLQAIAATPTLFAA